MVIPSLQKQHHLTRTNTGQIYSREISCKACLKLKAQLCEDCLLLSPVSVKPVSRTMSREEEKDNPEVEAISATEEDGGASDGGEDGSEGEEQDRVELCPGAIVWAM